MPGDTIRSLNYEPSIIRHIGALWGKSRKKAGGRTNLVLSHLLDTAAVAEQIWDQYLAPSTKQLLEEISAGRGRLFFAWLCGVHDCGKATPAFQRVDDEGAQALRRAGLTWNDNAVKQHSWRHDKAGGMLLRTLLKEDGWSKEHIAWLWPLVAGHHGSFPSAAVFADRRTARGGPQGRSPDWRAAQRGLVEIFTRLVGYAGLADVEPMKVPSRATQLQLSGLIVMADWIASDQRHFVGIDDLADVSMERARKRAAAAWAKLELRGGWGALPAPGAGTFQQRFGHGPRDSQKLVIDAASRMPTPGLLIVEAPMGEGKTKAAFLASEVLASAFGCDGVFVGMPTQATCDPIFTQVRAWLTRIRPDLADQVALLHGKRRFNKEWRQLLGEADENPDDAYQSVDEDDLYGSGADFDDEPEAERHAPAEWFLGSKRGLLSPFVVGTIDQLLYTATRTKHVMLRAAGLMGKVVILDEVHAADVYMSQFLKEALRWLGQARVPVVLLSATLPPQQRRALVGAYLAGAAARETFDVTDLREPQGYPNVTAACLVDGQPVYDVRDADQWRKDLQVKVTVLPEVRTARAGSETGEAVCDVAVAGLLADRLRDGGCALVIRNTVPRAQATFEALGKRFGADVRLLHGRMSAADRADRTEKCLDLLGPPGEDRTRPPRLVLVATQIAEQSFDVDVDVLVSDLTTIDLLLQRIGRMHRHDWGDRPGALGVPEVVITGFSPGEDGPSILPASEGIYSRYLLMRTAALVEAANDKTWSVPSEVPSLVAHVYGDSSDFVPTHWQEKEQEAYVDWARDQEERAKNAEPYLLTRAGEHAHVTLDGLHYGADRRNAPEEKLQAVVRDGDPSVEVVVVWEDERGYRTFAGRSLGVNGETSDELVDDVLMGTVRLPAKLTDLAERELTPLDGWRGHPWLKHCRALVLGAASTRELGEYSLRYDSRLGLVVTGGPKNHGRRR
ncbi:CRISPR-associated helicase/endonuclease Cas3 [Herbidospora daliensis]|uniref:CRISPR-associated helicase/endonuclease Cas3 n=1 Tax=Herbidospora daliensis TaxID=295585 RepID=UPI0007829D37|nr:CRISPR-associated helicase/endonuclease Cas3 [Herbidospora daliensis]